MSYKPYLLSVQWVPSFHVNPRFHLTHRGWNLELARKFSNPAGGCCLPACLRDGALQQLCNLFTLRKARSPMESELFLEWTDCGGSSICPFARYHFSSFHTCVSTTHLWGYKNQERGISYVGPVLFNLGSNATCMGAPAFLSEFEESLYSRKLTARLEWLALLVFNTSYTTL